MSSNSQNRKKTEGKRRIRRFLSICLIIVGLVWCGVSMEAYLRALFDTQAVVSETVEATATLAPEVKAELLSQAKAYNARLGDYIDDDPSAQIPREDIWPYAQQLDYAGNSTMGWIEIPKAGIELPIYHGVEDEELAQGAGHQSQTSLPIGGKKAFCMISGHSGMSSARMFDNIRCLEVNDVIGLHVLDDIYEYKVTAWTIVDPPSLTVEYDGGNDVLLLVTCTSDPTMFAPKGQLGINNKRLLFYAERVPYDPADFEVQADVTVYVNDTTVPIYIALVALLVLAAFIIIGSVRGRRRKKKKAANSSG